MSTNALSKRKQLGEAIAFLRGEQNMSRHNLADKTRTTVKMVERWETGEFAPSTQEWQRMRSVFAPLATPGSRYADMFRAAAAEQLAVEEINVAQQDAKSDMGAAVKLLVEAVPNLRSMAIEIDDDGEVSVVFKTREVRVVEDGGSIKLRVK